MDQKWWRRYLTEVRKHFSGELLTSSSKIADLGLHPFPEATFRKTGWGNSGAAAIAVAHFYGAARIVLLGYDCQRTRDQAHWHGDHPRILGNAGSMSKWPGDFMRLKVKLSPNVVNATRETALDCFPRMTLEQALEPYPAS
jgi:hypothetical protein